MNRETSNSIYVTFLKETPLQVQGTQVSTTHRPPRTLYERNEKDMKKTAAVFGDKFMKLRNTCQINVT
jgi:hypothetical protein